jgi:hypothetical protein
MTTYERLISELGDGLGIALSPDSAGLTEVFVEDRAVLVRADETGERELTIFTVLATAPEDGFSPAALQRALEMNLFGREVVGHHLGLFADSLILSSALPLEDLSAEALADRLVALVRLAGTLSESLSSHVPSPADAGRGGEARRA